MTRTITIFFDTSDDSNLGYSAQMPPARVQRAARVELGIGRTPITWARYNGAAEGWTGTLRD